MRARVVIERLTLEIDFADPEATSGDELPPMDPEMTLSALLNALCADTREGWQDRARERLAALVGWIETGGYRPRNPGERT